MAFVLWLVKFAVKGAQPVLVGLVDKTAMVWFKSNLYFTKALLQLFDLFVVDLRFLPLRQSLFFY